MNLLEVMKNCVYLLISTILIYIIVSLWNDLLMKFRLNRKLKNAKTFAVSNTDELRKSFEQIEKEVKNHESDSRD